jgi:hypothetical protein
MSKYAYGAGLIVTLMMPLLFVHFQAFGQEAKPTDPIFGTWVMDMSKSYSKRLDEQPTFTTQHMRILAPEGDDGVRNTLINDPAKPPNYSYTAKLDGKEYPDPRARSNDQKRTLTHWRLSPYVIMRLATTNGKATEWAIYTASADGETFTSISWVPDHPELVDFQVMMRKK